MTDAMREYIKSLIVNPEKHNFYGPYAIDPFRSMALVDANVQGMLELFHSGKIDWFQFLTELAVRQTAMRILVEEDMKAITLKLNELNKSIT